jgi:membrane protein implicated in regulation of membrane protease activity
MERRSKKWAGLVSALGLAIAGAAFGRARSPDAAMAAGAASKRTVEAMLTSLPFAIIVLALSLSLSAVTIVKVVARTHLAEHLADVEAAGQAVYVQNDRAVRDAHGNVVVESTRSSVTQLPEQSVLNSIGTQGPSPPVPRSLDAQTAGKLAARTAKGRTSRGRHAR